MTPSFISSPAESAEIRHRIANRIGGSLPLRGYVRGKIASDPAYPATLEILRSHPQPVLDIGCGLGLLAFYLREHGFTAPILGIDPDQKKIARAQQVARAHYHNVTFAVGDARDHTETTGTTVLLDILHYLDDPAQAALLKILARRAASGGTVIIRNTPRDQSWRYRLTYLEELWVRASRWIATAAPINFPTTEEIAAPFREAGCKARIEPLWGSTPFNSHLYAFSPAVQPCVS